ncbi:MAG: hypothetical protein LUK37_11465, partial [Clostridia bacterium]|nr:hypothetical protein [Clostridia bacterium]
MKKLLIVLWFGKFLNYFDLYLKSCSWNKGWNWMIFTDQDPAGYDIPGNVEFVRTSFEKIKERIGESLGVPLSRKARTYKLCDLKPFYGNIFSP